MLLPYKQNQVVDALVCKRKVMIRISIFEEMNRVPHFGARVEIFVVWESGLVCWVAAGVVWYDDPAEKNVS